MSFAWAAWPGSSSRSSSGTSAVRRRKKRVGGSCLLSPTTTICLQRATAPRKAQAHKKVPGHEVTAREARGAASFTLDVHGLTVNQALEAIDAALNDALLQDADELRVIHGRSSGRIRDALHRHVRGLSAVRTARLDPANAGVTIIVLS